MHLRTALITGLVSALVATCAPHAGATGPGLTAPVEKEIAMELVSSAENSSLDWKAQYTYLEDIHDGRGYTGGIIGFCSGTGDMLQVALAYTAAEPGNPLARFVPALRRVNGTASHAGLGAPFERAWHRAAADPAFQKAQDDERDRVYFDPAVRAAKRDGLSTLGQFIYYDAEEAHSDTSRVDDEQLVFLRAHNWGLRPTLSWHTYGDPYTITTDPVVR